jgi:LacI family transcriptional regulator
VVGFNDIEFAQDSNPPLTTIHVPMLEMGTEAARMLLEAIEIRNQEPMTVRLPVSLIVRGSTGPAPS